MRNISVILLIILIVAGSLYCHDRVSPTFKGGRGSVAIASKVATDGKSVAGAPSSVINQGGGGTVEAAEEDSIAKMWSTPRSVWGVVVDENDSPISEASVSIVANEKPYSKEDPEYHLTTDEKGLFKLIDKPAGLMYVKALKRKYYSSESSEALIFFAIPDDEFSIPIPTPEQPTKLILRRHSTPVHLTRTSFNVKVSNDGTPIELDLTRETPYLFPEPSPAGTGDIRIETWVFDSMGPDPVTDDWICRISAPGGGLVNRESKFDFEAPESGYVETIELRRPSFKKGAREFFVRTKNSQFARIKFEMNAISPSSVVVIGGLLNPDGSRNLESDFETDGGYTE